MFRPPKDDHERYMNLVEALAEPGDEPDALDEIMHAELKKRGHTLESWATEWEAKAKEVLERHERARRAKRIRTVATVGALALAACLALAFLQPMVLAFLEARRDKGNAAQPTTNQGCTCEAAGASSRDGGRPWAPVAGVGVLLGLLLLRRSKGRPCEDPPAAVQSGTGPDASRR